MPNLTDVRISEIVISDIKPIANLTDIRRRGLLVTDIKAFLGMNRLAELLLSASPIRDTSVLADKSQLAELRRDNA